MLRRLHSVVQVRLSRRVANVAALWSPLETWPSWQNVFVFQTLNPKNECRLQTGLWIGILSCRPCMSTCCRRGNLRKQGQLFLQTVQRVCSVQCGDTWKDLYSAHMPQTYRLSQKTVTNGMLLEPKVKWSTSHFFGRYCRFIVVMIHSEDSWILFASLAHWQRNLEGNKLAKTNPFRAFVVEHRA